MEKLLSFIAELSLIIKVDRMIISSKNDSNTLREEIFAGRKLLEFREFWPNSRR